MSRAPVQSDSSVSVLLACIPSGSTKCVARKVVPLHERSQDGRAPRRGFRGEEPSAASDEHRRALEPQPVDKGGLEERGSNTPPPQR
jgi:hypothetical protein